MGRIEGKIAVVTGGANGIGRSIVERFLAEGAKKVYSVDMASGKYEHPNLRHIEASVTDRNKLAAFAETLKAEEGGIVDILVNNAGITRDALLSKLSEDKWDIVLDVNLKGVFNMTQFIAPLMIANGKGAIVNISSMSGEFGNVGQSNYAAAKAGIIGLTYTWAKEFTQKGAAVRTNAIAPGYIETEMVLSVPEKVLDVLRAKNPMGRLGKPQEIANTVLFLASDEASYINGQLISVNGGQRT
ncbi:MAG: 3-oxoacyl-ACP reductase FabG [Acidaminococcales bacterium]|jgi:3-oxoacyl-[acyl-carrier protein] reductase|nr:3-oxoacyl-ACP reductase FabG [Acidaminococcales bacterium]